MLSNEQIVERIREIAREKGIANDAEIARRAGTTRTMLLDLPNLKTSPRLDTVEKFATGLGVSIEDIIYPASYKSHNPLDDQSRWKRILRSVNNVLVELDKNIPEDIKIDFVFYLYDNGFCRQFDHIANDNEVRPVVTENFLKSKVA